MASLPDKMQKTLTKDIQEFIDLPSDVAVWMGHTFPLYAPDVAWLAERASCVSQTRNM